jgi:hypothetical protein
MASFFRFAKKEPSQHDAALGFVCHLSLSFIPVTSCQICDYNAQSDHQFIHDTFVFDKHKGKDY